MWRLVFLVGAAHALVGCSGEPERDRPPNVVLISIDTLRADVLGVYGDPRPTSPVLDELARESIVFENAISQGGVTAPAHMSLLTSHYPSVHRVNNSNFAQTPKGVEPSQLARFKLSASVPTLASTLRDAGWRTAAFVSGGNLNAALGFDQGFDEFDDQADNGMNGNREDRFDFARPRAWLERNGDRRFFLFLHTYIPHSPYLPPKPWDRGFGPEYQGAIPSDRDAFFRDSAPPGARFQRYWGAVRKEDPRDVEQLRALYAGEVRHADEALATMLDALRDAGALENSIVIVTSDHGEEFLEHGKFEHPGDLYREHVHVPLIVRLPTRVSRRVPELVRSIDVMPTVLELVGAQPPPGLQGRSLVPAFTSSIAELPAISEMIFAWSSPDPASAEPADVLRALRTREWTYLTRVSAGERFEQLFRRSDDPLERRNVAGDPSCADALRKLRGLIDVHAGAMDELADSTVGTGRAELESDALDELRALGYVR